MDTFRLLFALTSFFVLSLAHSNEFESNLMSPEFSFYSEKKLDISTFYLDFLCRLVTGGRNISETCEKQLEIVCDNEELLEQMADAWSKFPYAGMLTASRQDWGAYDQCINIDYRPEEGPQVLGKHCANGLAIPVDITKNDTDFYLLSYCVPDACTASDLGNLISLPIFPEEISQLVNDVSCSTKESNNTLSGAAIFVATLFSFILAVLVVSTAYDVYLHQNELKKKTPILTAFSAFSNGRKLVETTKGKGTGEQILAIHGIKVISMMWILAGHAAGIFSIIPNTKRETLAGFEFERYALYIMSAQLAVDTFFFISGFLLSYQYFKGLAHKAVAVQIKSVPQMIVHRYLRITPVVLVFFLYSMYLGQHIGNGPIFPLLHESINKPCKDYWWAVFLYVQNYSNPTELCYTHLWYLSADWQLFLLAPLVLIPMASQFKKRFNTVLLATVALNILFLLIPIYTKLKFPDYDPNHLEYETHAKLVTYFMGVLFGFYLRCKSHEPYMFKKGLNIFMWSCAILILFLSTMLHHEVSNVKDYSHTTRSLTDVFIKPFWCLGLMFVIYSCTHGYGGIINWFLSAGWMQILGKLTYCMYILHVPVILFWAATRRTRQQFSNFELFFLWCGHFIISLIVSTVWTLMFESPLITIERLLLGGGQRKPRAPPPTQQKSETESPLDKITIIHKPPTETGYV